MYVADSGLPMIRFATLSRVFWCSGSLLGSFENIDFRYGKLDSFCRLVVINLHGTCIYEMTISKSLNCTILHVIYKLVVDF